MLPKAKRSDPHTGTMVGAPDILESVTGTRARQRSMSRMSVMLKRKGVLDGMRPADGCCSLLGGPSSSITRALASVSSGVYDSCLERPVCLEGVVETHCGDTQVTLPTVPSSTGVTATTVPFPLLPYDSLRKQEILQSTPAARPQQMSAHVTARQLE